MKNINFMVTGGGGPGYIAIYKSLRNSKKYKARIIATEINPLAANLYLDLIDKAFLVPPCSLQDYIDEIKKIIKTEKVDYLYCAIDEEMLVISRNANRILDSGCKLLMPPFPALYNSYDKWIMYEKLKNDISMPQTIKLTSDTDLAGIYKRFNGNVLIKARRQRGGRQIDIPEYFDEFKFFATRFIRRGIEAIIQEFVVGYEYNVTLFHDKKGSLIYAIPREKLEKRKIKSTTTAAVIRNNSEIRDMAIKAVEKMGLVPGFNNVEIIVTDKGSFLIEINGGRHAAQDMNIVYAGIPITDIYIDAINEESIEPVKGIQNGIISLKMRIDVIITEDRLIN